VTPENNLLTVNPLVEPAVSVLEAAILLIDVVHQGSQIVKQAVQALLDKANKASRTQEPRHYGTNGAMYG
jgi:hypothetical protein